MSKIMTKVLSSTAYHTPVLVQEVLEYLDPQPNKLYLDVTFGGGGHTRAILEREPHCQVVAIDWDLNSIEKNGPELEAEFGDRFSFLWGNFSYLNKLLKKAGIDKVDGILADFGTSQFQIKEAAGFSVYNDTPLDMRMSPSFNKITAKHVLNTYDEQRLADLFMYLGEERHARKIARAIVTERPRHKFRTTGDLVALIEKVVPASSGSRKIHRATKVFQALRIYVNQELENIEAFLKAVPSVLDHQGRLVCISFHSLEDRIVKQFLKSDSRFEILTPKVVTAQAAELAVNHAARSAKLRAGLFNLVNN
ncbi:MAG TPA: 16S rRNA (cytosine(1402)-N(4))-methyltransferase RsmH [Candidatus Babeliales bacterium]|nr:16S rRNA (cytosine(1402)-N(4))-methyltransferase RsmH [Candidatus Babeliales bacterium]